MKTYLFTLLLLLGPWTTGLFAQGQIPDGDFENWTAGGVGFYEEPSSGWWSSLNPLRDLGGPVSVEKSTDSHSGLYSAHLETKQFGTLLIPGILLSGSFNILAAPNYFTRGQDYSIRPDVFLGWYKYSAVGDTGAIAVQLTRWNTTTNQRDTVGEVGILIPQSVNSWTQFVLPIFYYSNDMPDTLVVVATSSADGANLNGAVGSELWVDDLDLGIAFSTGESEEVLDLGFVQTADEWRLDAGIERGTLEVLDLSGKVLNVFEVRPGVNVFLKENTATGLYLFRFRSEKGGVWFRKVPNFN